MKMRFFAALTAVALASAPRVARAEPDPPLTIGALDIPAMVASAGSLASATAAVLASADGVRVEPGWALAGVLFGTSAFVLGVILSLDAHEFSRDVGIVSFASGAVDIGTLIFNGRYGRRLPNQVTVGPRVFVDAPAWGARRVYGVGLTIGRF